MDKPEVRYMMVLPAIKIKNRISSKLIEVHQMSFAKNVFHLSHLTE